jgi:glucokinase
VAREAFRRCGQAVGLAITATAAMCDLELAVVGGGVAQAGELLFEPVRATLATHARLSFLRALRIEPAKLGGAAGLYGAAALAYSLI